MPGQDINSNPQSVGQGPTTDPIPQGVQTTEPVSPDSGATGPTSIPAPMTPGATQSFPTSAQPATSASPGSVPTEPPAVNPDDLTKAAEQIEEQADTAPGQPTVPGMSGQGPQPSGTPEK